MAQDFHPEDFLEEIQRRPKLRITEDPMESIAVHGAAHYHKPQ